MKKIFYSHLFAISIWALFVMVPPTIVNGQDNKWKVWVKTSPCSGRFNWISVAKEDPSGGGNNFFLADDLFPGTACTLIGCTFQEATVVATTLRTSPQFFNYCCRDYSVWENTQTGKMTVVLGKFGNAGFGWRLVKGDLCCEEAEELAGIPGACSGTTGENHPGGNNAPGEWRVWVKTSPCSGRFDWISVAKENPTGGGKFYFLADLISSPTGCTSTGCTFAAATAVANSIRTSPQFFNYCCRDYSVWENTQTGKMTVVVGKFGNAGFGWRLVKGDLCCEEAETLAGIPGACSGTTGDNHEEIVANTKCWPGSYAAWNAQTQKVECWCPSGKTWNDTKTACIDLPGTKSSNSDYSKLSGTWNLFSGSPNAGPVMQLNVTESSISGISENRSTAIKVTGGSYDAAAKTLYFNYLQEWTKRTGKAQFDFEESPNYYVLTGTWYHDDRSSNGEWTMRKKK